MKMTSKGMTATAAIKPTPVPPAPELPTPRIAMSNAISIAARRTSPGTSMPGVRTPGRATCRPVSGGTTTATTIAANRATGTARTKRDCQPNAPTRSPPMNGPIAALVETSMSNSPKAVPRRSAGDIARTSATEVVDTSAPLTAWRTRDAARTSNDGATTAISDEIANAVTPMRKTGRCPYRSPRLPLASNAMVTAPR